MLSAFSHSCQGIFCLPCVLFPMEQRTSGRAQVLVSRPLVNYWKNALADLSAHSILDYHLNSEAKFEAFLSSMAEPKTRVDFSLTAATQELVAMNRAILTSIMKCVELCGRQGLPLRVDMKLCHGQGYDGAGNGAMSGAFNGCQAHFIREVPQATYYHCRSHQLNLALSKACTVVEIHRMVDSLKTAGLFFKYSPKRQHLLETCIDRANEKRRKEKQKEIKRKKFKLLCETRWVERHTALEDFHELYEPIKNCLARIAAPQVMEDEPGGIKWDTISSTEAAGLLNVLQSSEFLIAFYTCHYFFAYTYKDVARMLQGESKDVLAAYLDIRTATACISDARNDAAGCFSGVFQLAEQAANLLGEEFKIPRRCGRQTQRSNHPAEDAVDYWRRAVFIPFADQLISELNGRFNQLATTAVSGFAASAFAGERCETRFQTRLGDWRPSGSLLHRFACSAIFSLRSATVGQRMESSFTRCTSEVLVSNCLGYQQWLVPQHLLSPPSPVGAPITSASVERANVPTSLSTLC